jgi:molecular chaperone DnaK
MEKTIKDAGDKLPAEIKTKFESAIADAKKDLESNDADAHESRDGKLTALGGELYAAAQKATEAAGAAAPEGGAAQADAEACRRRCSTKKTEKKADVVDADFEVVDDNNKKK